jgi:hypothetical protein
MGERVGEETRSALNSALRSALSRVNGYSQEDWKKCGAKGGKEAAKEGGTEKKARAGKS